MRGRGNAGVRRLPSTRGLIAGGPSQRRGWLREAWFCWPRVAALAVAPGLDVPNGVDACHHDRVTGMGRPQVTCEDAAAELRRGGLIDAALTECVPLAGGAASRVAALSRPGGPPEAGDHEGSLC